LKQPIWLEARLSERREVQPAIRMCERAQRKCENARRKWDACCSTLFGHLSECQGVCGVPATTSPTLSIPFPHAHRLLSLVNPFTHSSVVSLLLFTQSCRNCCARGLRAGVRTMVVSAFPEMWRVVNAVVVVKASALIRWREQSVIQRDSRLGRGRG